MLSLRKWKDKLNLSDPNYKRTFSKIAFELERRELRTKCMQIIAANIRRQMNVRGSGGK